MTLYIVGLRYKTRSHALTIEAEDALIAALKANTQNLTQQLRTFENPIGVGTTVIRMKDCRIRNEISLSRLELARRLALMLACLLRFVRNAGQDVGYG